MAEIRGAKVYWPPTVACTWIIALQGLGTARRTASMCEGGCGRLTGRLERGVLAA